MKSYSIFVSSDRPVQPHPVTGHGPILNGRVCPGQVAPLGPETERFNALCTTRMSRIVTQMQYRSAIVINLYARHSLWDSMQGNLYSNGRSGSFRP
jgi:hypothetical protein